MLLYITGSFPENKEGIASSAKVLLDAMIEIVGKERILLLTTDTPVITRNIRENAVTEYELLSDWRMVRNNIHKITSILHKYPITAVHMEYPGDLYGKTFLASFLPLIIHRYNRKHEKSISVNVRLHEFTCARLLRKIAILPILFYADRVYVPAQKDRETVSRIAGKRVLQTMIGANIKVVPSNTADSDKITISYFGSVYPGKGIERMLSVWKKIKEMDVESKFLFKVIGEIDVDASSHFAEYHKQVWKWIAQYGLENSIEVTGYVTDEEASKKIQDTQIATLLYEDGLTLRRGSFLAYLAHGIPIVTTMGDMEARQLFSGHDGIRMAGGDREIINAILEYSRLGVEDRKRIREDNVSLARNFDWGVIASAFMKDYGMIE